MPGIDRAEGSGVAERISTSFRVRNGGQDRKCLVGEAPEFGVPAEGRHCPESARFMVATGRRLINRRSYLCYVMWVQSNDCRSTCTWLGRCPALPRVCIAAYRDIG